MFGSFYSDCSGLGGVCGGWQSGDVLDQGEDFKLESISDCAPSGGLMQVQVPGQSISRRNSKLVIKFNVNN